jgi:ADP-ribose pyrophosphatase
MNTDTHTEKRLSGETVFRGKVVHIIHDMVELENGRTALREVIAHPGAVAVLARTGDSVTLVRQFRYAVGQELLEIPAGKLEPGEDPLSAAPRELWEETGLTAGPLTFLGDYYASPGILGEVIHLYYTEPAGADAPHPDDDEFVTATAVPIDRLRDMIARGEIRDGKTLAAYTLAQARGLLEPTEGGPQ